MFLPIGIETPRRNALATWLLILANVAAYYSYHHLPASEIGELFRTWGAPGAYFDPLRAMVSGFLHADIFHLVGNMYFLMLFGRSVEAKLGHVRYLFLYLVLLFFSEYAQQRFQLASYSFSIGASGAVAGMIGAYACLFPGSQVLCLSGSRRRTYAVWVSVWIAVLATFAWDALLLYAQYRSGLHTGIGSLAHLGGLFAGILLAGLFRASGGTIENPGGEKPSRERWRYRPQNGARPLPAASPARVSAPVAAPAAPLNGEQAQRLTIEERRRLRAERDARAIREGRRPCP
ncbi:MAG: rhomboid family intramembrane serine protease [Planctomycetes bacterium]|nr:rhomboid family intramembrane serine protease [Planctomycetota bacterium]